MNPPSPYPAPPPNRRILVIDDNIAIHDDVRKILCPAVNERAEALAELERELLGSTPPFSRRSDSLCFEVDSAYQGQDGLELLNQALAQGRPYAMAIVDVRMPPGWDGIETTLALWQAQPDLQVVICTAYSDYSWEEMLRRLGSTDRLVILRKPFDTIEVLQLAASLTEKWNLTQASRRHAAELEERVRIRTADLESANAALEAEIQRRVAIERELIRAKDAAESAARAKSAFLANMSHEIRTPMNGVIGMANLLSSTPLNPEQQDFVQTLTTCCDSLLTIINDILDFSKVDAGRLQLELADFDLVEAVQLAVDIQSEAASRKNLEVVLEVDPQVPTIVRGDVVRLRQVLLNLIGNAVKFTERGEIVVKATAIEATAAAKTAVRFEIEDTGIGIAADVQSSLFQPFVQADSSMTRRYGGTGLGLAICKRIVELMNGQIGVDSRPSRGSRFWFTVELEPASEPAASISYLPLTVPGSGALIVDDSAASRKLLVDLFKRWDVKGSACDSAAAAITALRRAAEARQPFGLVVLDHEMPGTSGPELAAIIQSEPQFRRPPLVLLSSRRDRPSNDQLVGLGIDACALKPIHEDQLRNAVGRALNRTRSSSEVTERTPSADVARSPARILVAEDNPVNQKVITLMLRNLGFDCQVVGNGREALAALKRSTFEIIFMDEHMPEMNGIEAAKEIRRLAAEELLPVSPRIPIVATTADAMPDTRARCLEAGMDDFLAKPIRVDELRAAIAAHLPNASGDCPPDNLSIATPAG